MWIVRPQSVTHCQRRLAAKFQFLNRLRKTISKMQSKEAAQCTRGNI